MGNAAAPDLCTIFPDCAETSAGMAQALADAVPDAVLVFDKRERLAFANAPARRYLLANQFPRNAELSALNAAFRASRSFAGPPVSAGELPVARALLGETVGPEEYLVQLDRQGVSLWVEFVARPLRKEGEISGAILIVRNIADRKRQELAQQHSEQFRDLIYEGNLTGVIHSSVEGRILDCNEVIVKMLGYSSREELRGTQALQLYFNRRERERVLRIINRQRRLREFELCYKRKDGSACWGLVNARLFDERAGQFAGTIIAVVVDITDLKLQADTLRRSEQRFSAFMRHLPGIAFIKNPDGKYVYGNEAFGKLFSRTSAEIVSTTDWELWPAEESARHRENDAVVIRTGNPLERLEAITQADGEHTWLISKFPIFDETGKVCLVGGIGVDLTERQVLEDQLAQARKMEALGRLAGGVAHDFNNLLTVISGYGQLALESGSGSPSGQVSRYLQEMLNAARRAAGLTARLLAFSRPQSIEAKTLDLCGLVRDLERLLQRLIGEHIDLAVHCSQEPCYIQADPHQIEQVLVNLAINSRDAMPLGGILDIHCSALAQPIERAGIAPLEIRLEVRDTGVGMDGSVKAQLFEPFFTSKEKGRGTGLGLATVYGVVTEAGGKIEVDSSPGEGCAFRIYLPRAPEPVETHLPAPVTYAPPGIETVLLVEDEPSVRTLAEAMLKRLGYSVVTADSGLAALEIWRKLEGGVDILLTDVVMPQMSGGELAQKLRGMKPALKILFMSGYTDDMLIHHGVLEGEIHLIQKPFTAEMLGARLRSVLDGETSSGHAAAG